MLDLAGDLAAFDRLTDAHRLALEAGALSLLAAWIEHHDHGAELVGQTSEPLSDTHPLRYCHDIDKAAAEVRAIALGHAAELDRLEADPARRAAAAAAEARRQALAPKPLPPLPLPPSAAHIDDTAAALELVTTLQADRQAETDAILARGRNLGRMGRAIDKRKADAPTPACWVGKWSQTDTDVQQARTICSKWFCRHCGPYALAVRYLEHFRRIVDAHGLMTVHVGSLPDVAGRDRYASRCRKRKERGTESGSLIVPIAAPAFFVIADHPDDAAGTVEVPVLEAFDMLAAALDARHEYAVARKRQNDADPAAADVGRNMSTQGTWNVTDIRTEGENPSSPESVTSDRMCRIGTALQLAEPAELDQLARQHGGRRINARKGITRHRFPDAASKRAYLEDVERLYGLVSDAARAERHADDAARRQWEADTAPPSPTAEPLHLEFAAS